MATSPRLDELRKKFDENPRRYFAPLANECRKLGDLTEAVAICRTHLPNQPGHISGHVVLAQALYESGDLEEARQVFESALELDPENLIALRYLGDIARERQEPVMARIWYERVLEVDPRNEAIVAQLQSLDTPAFPAGVLPATLTAAAPAPGQEAEGSHPPPEIEVPDASWDRMADAGPEFMASEAPEAERAPAFTESSDDHRVPAAPEFNPHDFSQDDENPFASPFPAASFAEAMGEPEAVAEPATDDWFAPAERGAAGDRSNRAPHGESEDAGVELFPDLETVTPRSSPVVPDLDAHLDAFNDDVFETFVGAADGDAADGDAADGDAADGDTAPGDAADDGQDAFESSLPSVESVTPVFNAAVAPEPRRVEWPSELASFTPESSESISSGLPAFLNEADDGSHGVPTPGWSGASADAPTADAPTAHEPTADAPIAAREYELSLLAMPEAGEDDAELADARSLPEVAEGALEDTPAEAGWDSDEPEDDHDFEAEQGAFIGTTPALDAAEPEPTPSAFVTETMAELYLQQGFQFEALAIYRELLAQQPDDDALRGRVAALERGEASTVVPGLEARSVDDRLNHSVRSFFSHFARREPRGRRDAQGGSDLQSAGETVDEGRERPDFFAGAATRDEALTAPDDRGGDDGLTQLFQAAQVSGEDEAAAESLAAAFGAPAHDPSAAGPLHERELSLEHLFRDVPAHSPGAVTLDEFSSASPDASRPAEQAGADAGESDADIEQFTAWLQGLKKK